MANASQHSGPHPGFQNQDSLYGDFDFEISKVKWRGRKMDKNTRNTTSEHMLYANAKPN